MLKRVLFFIFLLLLIFILNAFLNPIPKKNTVAGFKPTYGVTYSFEQAGWYGLDGRKAYIDLLSNYNFDWIRLPFFWDQMVEIETEEQRDREIKDIKLKIDDLKFAVEEAEKRGIKVIIALGAKTPYFPEYHWPKEISSQVAFGERIDIDHPVADDILEIDKKAVEALSVYDNISHWQVENEPLIGNVNKWKIDPALVAKEVEVVRSTDFKKRPVILNHAATGFYDTSWHELLSILKPGDVFAVNAFFKTKGTDIFNAQVFGREIHILWPDHLVWPVHSWGIFSPNFESIKKKVEKNGNAFWILEMQAEPYIKKLNEADDPFLSFRPDDIFDADSYLRSFEIESIGLWGVHFWQYQKMNGNSQWLDVVSKILAR